MIENNKNLQQLPKGWVWTKLGEIGQLIRGVSYKKKEASKEIRDGYLPIVRANNIQFSLNFDDLIYVPREKIVDEQLVKAHDIIIAMSSGSKDLVGKAAQAMYDFSGGFGAFCGLFRVFDMTNKKFFGFFFQSPKYRNSISNVSSGVNINNLRREHIENMVTPLPPLPEQHHIVANIEELFTKLDAGVEALKKVKVQLKRYRQAVLKSAFEGKLTEEWREAHKGELEPAYVLLERIKEERRKNAKGKFKELPPVDTSDLPELPEGWVWARMGEIVVDVEKVNPKDNPEREFIYLDIASIDNKLQRITNPKKYLGKDAPSRAKQLVKADDILFSTVRTYLKNIAMVNSIYNGQIASTGFCVIRPHSLVNSNLIFQWVQRDFFLNPLTQIQRGTSYPAVRESDVFAQFLPLSPFIEQRKIVEEIESCLSMADEIERVAERSLRQSERLRQSILKKAFEGRLVSQDPSDEPAEKLLERIKEEKAKRSLEEKSKKKVKKGD
jgi:type I restriction enzyme S subunit